MIINIKDERDEYISTGFLRAEDIDRNLYAHFKIYIYSNNFFTLEKFLFGNAGNNEFQCADWGRDTLFFKGRGRGRKPEWSVIAMRDFIKEVQQTTSNATICDYL